jgi:hypothetical protein
MTQKTKADWTLIEVDYRAGIKTLEQIGEEYGVTKGRVSQVAKKQGWTRDLAEKIRLRAEAKVNERTVNEKLNEPKRRLAESEVVEANAQAAADVVMRHRQGLGRLAALRDKLLDEVESITDNKELFAQLGELMDESGEDANGRFKQDKRNEIYRKVIGMTERIDNTKKLAEIDEKVRKGEREAFNLDDGESKESSIDSLLKKINQEAV